MNKIICMFAGILIGGMMMMFAFQYHIVQTGEQTLVISRTESELADAWVNVAEWKAADWSKHPHLSDAMIKAGHGNLVQRSLGEEILDIFLDRVGLEDSPQRQ